MKSSSSERRHSMSRPRSSGITRNRFSITPSIIAPLLLKDRPSDHADAARVADHEAVGGRPAVGAADGHVLADQAVAEPCVQPRDAAVFEDDGVFDLGVVDDDAVEYRRVGADEGVGELAAVT